MTNVLFECSGERESLPTLRAFLKSNGKRKLPKVFPVHLIWLPNKFPNIVFETERFRAIVYKGDSIYEQLSGSIEGLIYESTGLGISPDLDNPGKFSIVSLGEQSFTVDPIFDLGYRINY